MSEFDEEGVSNNGFFRSISNALDSIPGFKDSSLRAEIHGVYHDYVGWRKEMNGNHIGAEAERRRAQEQYERARNGGPGEPYD